MLWLYRYNYTAELLTYGSISSFGLVIRQASIVTEFRRGRIGNRIDNTPF